MLLQENDYQVIQVLRKHSFSPVVFKGVKIPLVRLPRTTTNLIKQAEFVISLPKGPMVDLGKIKA